MTREQKTSAQTTQLTQAEFNFRKCASSLESNGWKKKDTKDLLLRAETEMRTGSSIGVVYTRLIYIIIVSKNS